MNNNKKNKAKELIGKTIEFRSVDLNVRKLFKVELVGNVHYDNILDNWRLDNETKSYLCIIGRYTKISQGVAEDCGTKALAYNAELLHLVTAITHS